MEMEMKEKEMQIEEEEYFTISMVMPKPKIVKYHDLLEKLWGWGKLLPKATSVSLSVYSTYLEEYHRRNVHAVTTDTSISALAETCLSNEKQLVSELKLRVTPGQERSLMIRRSIILSCLIQAHARSVLHAADCSISDVSGAALLCIAKEAGLTCELLRRGADPIDDYLISQGRVIRLCALSLMNRPSVSASAAMLGMAKEAEMICMWMFKNSKPVDFYDDPIPDEIRDRDTVRSGTLKFMVSILEKSSAEHKIDKEEPTSRSGPRGDGYGIAVDGAANTTRGSISDVLDSQYKKKIRDEEDSKKTEREEECFLEKLWGWERLVPLCNYVKWSDYGRYLEEYYKHNANGFVAAAAAAARNPQNTTTADMGAAVAKFCLKMEEELLRCSLGDASTIVESSLIKDTALKICGTGDIPSIVAFVCIKEEAGLMCELLKHGVKPSDDIIQLSSVIRMCALSLVNLREPQSIASAAAMVGMANEAKMMCDWMKKENKLITLSLSQPHELHGSCLIRMKALDIMTRILHGCFFPSSKQNTVSTAATSVHPDAAPEESAGSQASVEDTPKPKPNKPDAVPEEGAGSQASAGCSRPVNLTKTKVVVAMSKGDELEREYFIRRIKEMEEEDEEGEESGKTTKKRPLPHIVKYHGLLEKLWGWDRLLQLGQTVTMSDYTTYLEEYHRHYVHAATTDKGLSAPAVTCLMNEKQLLSELMARVKPEEKLSLPMQRSIIMSCLIQERVHSVIHSAGCKLSDVYGAALLCIAKEADLTCELLRLEAPIDDYLITQGTTIRSCALCLMNCTRDSSVSASAVMLGMVREAEILCSWMHTNKKPIDFDDFPIPSELWDCDDIRRNTLDFMVNDILKNSWAAEHKTVKEEPAAEHVTVKEEPARSGAGCDWDNIAADGAANTTVGSQNKKGGEKSNKWKGGKNFGGEKSNKRKRKEEDVLGKIWCWERLVMPPDSSVKWSDYKSYLEKYYESSASGFVAAAAAKNPQNVNDMALAVAKFCLEMEEKLLSVWNTRVLGRFGDPLVLNTIVESSLIKEHALLICGSGAESDLPSAIAFVCIAKEAELMCELLKHGAKPSSQVIQLSSVTRICALGLLKGHQSSVSAAAMMGMANEAKEMCDWMRRENKLVTLSLSEPRGLEVSHFIRNKALDVMTSILHESFQPPRRMP